MTYRRFAAADELIAEDWASRPETADAWTLGAAIGRGEAGSYHATSDKGCRAACKPAIHANGTPRGAHELIASNLARELHLPVPAVCLWIHSGTGALFAISAWAFAQALTWGEIATRLSATFMQNAAATFSAARVFHTWIGDADHNGNPGNVIVDVTSTDSHPIGIKNGMFDKQTCYDFWCGVLCRCVEAAQPVLAHVRARPGHSATYSELESLYREWKERDIRAGTHK
jgi:hypothetical protein